MVNDQRRNFAKAAKNLVYVPEPLWVLSLYCEFSVNYCPCQGLYFRNNKLYSLNNKVSIITKA